MKKIKEFLIDFKKTVNVWVILIIYTVVILTTLTTEDLSWIKFLGITIGFIVLSMMAYLKAKSDIKIQEKIMIKIKEREKVYEKEDEEKIAIFLDNHNIKREQLEMLYNFRNLDIKSKKFKKK